ncbi:DUF4010 domain-containing protein [Kaustia mangrovi]|uniref:DUF4010 domain-containing protein n=1 Tax=Kaustia mangrovi TaxID=2593653 RepID=A0A7S8C0Z9_9HYPH|nr:DUF4010 domain-containing protein [Kaustia mangrovi]QPC41373.1 DUF4010 domain-containing protein [Kaustia mangrovi]
MPAVGFAAFAGAFIVFRLRGVRQAELYGMTTVVAAMLDFALGAYALVGNQAAAAAAAVATTGLLAVKGVLHEWVQKLSWRELRASLILLAMVFILLPILPDREIEPLGVNPYDLWLLTILIAAVSFVGYVAIKVMGERYGLLLAAVAGGLASSTAATLHFARLAKTVANRKRSLSGAALLANLVMYGRVAVLVGLFSPAMLVEIGPPLALGALATGAVAAVLLQRDFQAMDRDAQEMVLKNPFEFGMVLRFGVLLAVVFILAAWLKREFGQTGIYVLSAISGILDVDAITLTLARSGGPMLGILIAVAMNTLAKAGIGMVAGGRTVAALLSVGAAAGIAGIAAGLWLVETL